MTNTRILVDLGERSYPVLVGYGALRELDSILPPKSRRALIVTQSSIPVVVDCDRVVATVHIPQGEQAKSLATIEMLCERFAANGITRDDVIIGVGGGLVTDVAGFAASVWHRGTSVVHIATTLLAMVDAAIGGKTGVNLAQGKNLVGAFWQPHGVICDLDTLDTLPDSELRCGRGEIAKYQFLTGEDLQFLSLAEQVAACVRIKADIVSSDEREGGLRALLNYGHTLGHAMETVGGHELAHGEAVAIGLVFAAHLAHSLGFIDKARVDYHEQVISGSYGLRLRPPPGMNVDDLMLVMSKDKKAIQGLTFVLDSADGLRVVPNIDPGVVRATLCEFLELSRP